MAVPRGLKEPHVLLASGNPKKLIRNLALILSPIELQKIQNEVDNNVISLYALGIGHYEFAMAIPVREWRQNISRLYYAAYNIKRAVSLKNEGLFSTDSSDHTKIDILPDSFDNVATYRSRLKALRDDRNLSDYSHAAAEADLLYGVAVSRTMVSDFVQDAKKFLLDNGVQV
jgi:hypothetical protein